MKCWYQEAIQENKKIINEVTQSANALRNKVNTVHSSRFLLKSASRNGPICPRQICCTGIGRGNAADVSPRPPKISGNFTAGGKHGGSRRLCEGSLGKIRQDDCKFLYINICNFPTVLGTRN